MINRYFRYQEGGDANTHPHMGVAMAGSRMLGNVQGLFDDDKYNDGENIGGLIGGGADMVLGAFGIPTGGAGKMLGEFAGKALGNTPEKEYERRKKGAYKPSGNTTGNIRDFQAGGFYTPNRDLDTLYINMRTRGIKRPYEYQYGGNVYSGKYHTSKRGTKYEYYLEPQKKAHLDKLAKQHNLPEHLLPALGYQESGRGYPVQDASGKRKNILLMRNNAKSHVGAVGPFQFMKDTGRAYGLRIDDEVDERTDFYKASEAAAKKLSKNYDQLGSLYYATGAYNAGRGRVNQYLTKGRALPGETQRYMPSVAERQETLRGYPSSLTVNDSDYAVVGKKYDYADPRTFAANAYRAQLPKAQMGGSSAPQVEIEGGEYVFNLKGVNDQNFQMLDNTGKEHVSKHGFLAKGMKHKDDNSGGIKVAKGDAYIASQHLGINAKKSGPNNPSVASLMLKYGGKALANGAKRPDDKFGISDWSPGAKKHHLNMMNQIARDAEINKIKKSTAEQKAMLKKGGVINPSTPIVKDGIESWNKIGEASKWERSREAEMKQDYKNSMDYSPTAIMFDDGGMLDTYNSLSHLEKVQLARELQALPEYKRGGYLSSCLMKKKKGGKVATKPKNPGLYSRVKSEAKRKFDVYPSRYANYWLTKEYKKRGGSY